MSDSDLLSCETIFLDIRVNDSAELFSVVYEELLKKGYVEEGFLRAVIAREKKYPTGLQCEDHVIAIPHTDPEYVRRPFIAAVRTIEPVSFLEMTNSGINLETRLIFILGLKRSGEQVMMLKAIMDNFAKDNVAAAAFLKAKDINECLDILKPLEIGKDNK